MLNAQFDIKRINKLKEILLRLRHAESSESIQTDFNHYFKDVRTVDILLIKLELMNGDYGITIEDLKKFSNTFPHLYTNLMNEEKISTAYHPGHPVQVFKEENTAFQFVLNQDRKSTRLNSSHVAISYAVFC